MTYQLSKRQILTSLWQHTKTKTHAHTKGMFNWLMHLESLCWLLEVKFTAVRPKRDRSRKRGRHEAHCLHPVSLLRIQLSSKALYWHDCPKLTIQLEGFTLLHLLHLFMSPENSSPVYCCVFVFISHSFSCLLPFLFLDILLTSLDTTPPSGPQSQ